MFGCVVLLHGCGGLRGGIAAFHGFHPLLPVSGTGTGFGPLPSREKGDWWLVWLVGCPALWILP